MKPAARLRAVPSSSGAAGSRASSSASQSRASAARAGPRAIAMAAVDQSSKVWLISGRSSSHSPG